LDSANAQKILGYFIEEAKEHLETLEQGILDLGNLVNNTEQMNEMFRASHSIKGGAAMLGYSSIQKTAHRLEDAFKILKENPIQVDQKLESLFLKGYDLLQILIDKLPSPLGLQAEEANAIVKKGEPTFAELQSHLNYLLEKKKIYPSYCGNLFYLHQRQRYPQTDVTTVQTGRNQCFPSAITKINFISVSIGFRTAKVAIFS